MTAPTECKRATRGALAFDGFWARAAIPTLESTPVMLNESLIETGRPCRGPIGEPVRLMCSSSSLARARAESKSGSVRQRVIWWAIAARYSY
jgi:hypothetical protein